MKTRVEIKEHKNLIKLVHLGLHEQSEIMSTELYSHWSVSKRRSNLPRIKVIHTVTHDSDEKTYVIFVGYTNDY